MAYHWICPYCGHHQTVTDEKSSRGKINFRLADNEFGKFGMSASAIGCANTKCKKVQLRVTVAHENERDSDLNYRRVILSRQLLPESEAKPQPDFIPAPLREDYIEACLVRDLSPKASATLARRCLQGMIRDFCGIAKTRLIDEIGELKKRVDADTAPRGVSPESVEAIDQVRSIGNIGAHMEKDINLIVEVDPNEAQALIELIETLFEEWYVDRFKRQERLAKVKAVAEEKRIQLGDVKANLGLPKPSD